MKQKNNLFDDFMAAHSWQKHTIGASALRASTKFVLDQQASAFVGEITRKVGVELLTQHRFARPPFPITWIELDHISYWRALTHLEPDDTADDKWGLFIINDAVHVITNALHDQTPLVLPLRFHLHSPVSFEYELELAQKVGMSRLMLRKHLVGSLGGNCDKERFQEVCDDIARSHRAELMVDWVDNKQLKPEHWNTFMSSSSGDLKLILAVLLLLTRPGRQILTRQDHPRRAGLSRGKRRVFLEHTTVHMRLNVRDPITKVLDGLGSGTSPRRHPVRGHWCQTRKVGKGCEHKWIALDEDHYECGLGCGARRWWRENCWRGRFDEGFVSREGYEVHK